MGEPAALTYADIDLRVGGDYHIVFVTGDGIECSFRGTYLEIEPRGRTGRSARFRGTGSGNGVRRYGATCTRCPG
jgi:hypothetical protein